MGTSATNHQIQMTRYTGKHSQIFSELWSDEEATDDHLGRGRVKAGGKSVNLNSITKYQKTTCSCSAEESYKVPSSSLKDRGFFRHNSISFFCATFVSRLGPIFTKSNSSPDDCLVDIKLLSLVKPNSWNKSHPLPYYIAHRSADSDDTGEWWQVKEK